MRNKTKTKPIKSIQNWASRLGLFVRTNKIITQHPQNQKQEGWPAILGQKSEVSEVLIEIKIQELIEILIKI